MKKQKRKPDLYIALRAAQVERAKAEVAFKKAELREREAYLAWVKDDRR